MLALVTRIVRARKSESQLNKRVSPRVRSRADGLRLRAAAAQTCGDLAVDADQNIQLVHFFRREHEEAALDGKKAEIDDVRAQLRIMGAIGLCHGRDQNGPHAAIELNGVNQSTTVARPILFGRLETLGGPDEDFGLKLARAQGGFGRRGVTLGCLMHGRGYFFRTQ